MGAEEARLRHESTSNGRSYQELMRALGAMLDQDEASRISLVEVDDGFVLQRQRIRHSSVDLAVSHSTHDSLRRRALQLREQQARVRLIRGSGVWTDFPHTHQDFLRSLGYELDEVGACQVVLDELSDGLLLCYQQVSPDGHRAESRRLMLSRSDIEEILNEAVRRRRTAGGGPASVQVGAGLTEAGGKSAEQGRSEWAPMRDSVPYQHLLRSLGAALDECGAERVCLLEAPDGIAVRYQPTGDDRIVWTRFTNDQLEGDRTSLRQQPGFLRKIEIRTPGGYQDLLRALGHDLERRRASGVIVVEQNDGLAVTYRYLDPDKAFAAVREMMFLGRQEQDDLRQAAHLRRPPEFRPRSFLGRRSSEGSAAANAARR